MSDQGSSNSDKDSPAKAAATITTTGEGTAVTEENAVVAGTSDEATVLPVKTEESLISEENEILVLYKKPEDLDETSETERVPDLSLVPVPLALRTPPRPRNQTTTTVTSSAEDILASSSSFLPLTPSEIRELERKNP